MWYKRQSRCWVFLTQWLWSSSAGWPWINIRPPPESSQPCVLLGKYMWYSEKLPVKTTKVKIINIPWNFKNQLHAIQFFTHCLPWAVVLYMYKLAPLIKAQISQALVIKQIWAGVLSVYNILYNVCRCDNFNVLWIL